ncbi:hypothetical protein M0802_010888 [Mischocyttarus mexicanus]|nr:hypothetical protein M0802_010888 [Mischocyttarus mexicanus]
MKEHSNRGQQQQQQEQKCNVENHQNKSSFGNPVKTEGGSGRKKEKSMEIVKKKIEKEKRKKEGRKEGRNIPNTRIWECSGGRKTCVACSYIILYDQQWQRLPFVP